MSKLVTVSEQAKTWGQMIQADAMMKQIASAVPRHVKAERIARMALTEMRRTPKLFECTQESVLGSLMQCASLGLEPGPMGLAYLIPYKKECTFQLGYKGLLTLCWNSDKIASVQSEVVREHDVFSYDEGSNAFVRFKRKLDGERGLPIAVFAAITVKGGGTIVRIMSAADIVEHRKKFVKAPAGGAWDTAPDEMWCKTVLKRAAKRAPISAEAQGAVSLDDQAELGLPQEIDVTPPPQATAALPAPSEEPGSGPERDPETGEVIPDGVGVG